MTEPDLPAAPHRPEIAIAIDDLAESAAILLAELDNLANHLHPVTRADPEASAIAPMEGRKTVLASAIYDSNSKIRLAIAQVASLSNRLEV